MGEGEKWRYIGQHPAFKPVWWQAHFRPRLILYSWVTHAIPQEAQRLPGRDTGLPKTLKGSLAAFATEESQLGRAGSFSSIHTT